MPHPITDINDEKILFPRHKNRKIITDHNYLQCCTLTHIPVANKGMHPPFLDVPVVAEAIILV